MFDSELKVLDILWRGGDLSAKQLSVAAEAEFGWNKNTTYTVIKKLVEKGLIERGEPGFICRALLSRDEARQGETARLIDRLWDGSKKAFFAAFVDEQLSAAELDELKALIESK